MLAPGQQQARTSLENRLFAQGRLGSTGGSQQFGSLLDAQSQARNQLMQQSLFGGTQQRGQEINQGMALFGGGLDLNQASIQAANLGLQGGQGGLQADMFNAQQAANSPDMFGSALTGLGGAIGGMESFGGGSMGGAPPMGIAAPGMTGGAPMTGGSLFNPYGYTGF